MTISKLKTVRAAALVCALVVGDAQRLILGQSAATEAMTQLAEVLKQQPAQAVSQFADVLKRHQPRRSGVDGDRMQIYMLDLVAGGTTLIADESVHGFDLERLADVVT